MAALPLRVRAEVLGAVAFGFDAPRTFGPEERELLLGAAEQCALALDRARLHEAEVRSRALLDAVLDAAPIGIAFLDRDQRFARVNRTLATMNGLPVEAHLGRTPGEVFPGLPSDEMEGAFREVMRTGKPLIDLEVEGETPSAPGKRRNAVSSWYPVSSGSETLGVGVLVREVTREREAEEFQRNVVGIVGHDLRTPLAALVTSVRLLLGSEDLPPARARLAARIFSNAERMDRIISVLHDYARVRAGQRIPIRRQPCDVGAIVSGVAEECEASRPGRTVRRRGEGDPLGEWDPDRLAQALANLVGNALDYSPADSTVEVSWRGEPREVIVSVANEGEPIPPEVLQRVFEPFRRGERTRPGGKDGLGLGLFIARAIVVAHGGRIEARSDPSGTTFTLHLPRSRAQRG
jgi:PAS domain S-box-containing protein